MVCPVVRDAPQPLPVSFADRDGERSSCSFTVWIVTLRTGLSNLFSRRPRRRNWGAVNKRSRSLKGEDLCSSKKANLITLLHRKFGIQTGVSSYLRVPF